MAIKSLKCFLEMLTISVMFLYYLYNRY